MTGWTFVVLEAFCCYSWAHKKYTKVIPFDPKNIDKKEKGKKIKNPCYVKGKKPKYCPKLPAYICLAKNCPFFAYGKANVEGEKNLKKERIALIVNLND